MFGLGENRPERSRTRNILGDGKDLDASGLDCRTGYPVFRERNHAAECFLIAEERRCLRNEASVQAFELYSTGDNLNDEF